MMMTVPGSAPGSAPGRPVAACGPARLGDSAGEPESESGEDLRTGWPHVTHRHSVTSCGTGTGSDGESEAEPGHEGVRENGGCFEKD